MSKLGQREQLADAFAIADRLSGLLCELDLAANPSMADKEELGFWKRSLKRELAALEDRLKETGVARFARAAKLKESR